MDEVRRDGRAGPIVAKITKIRRHAPQEQAEEVKKALTGVQTTSDVNTDVGAYADVLLTHRGGGVFSLSLKFGEEWQAFPSELRQAVG